MPTSIYEREDLQDEGLILIHENKGAAPGDKKIRLVRDPWVSLVPWGNCAGVMAVFVQVSFSPLNGFYHGDDEHSVRDDASFPVYTVKEIVQKIRNKQPAIVYLCGGDPMFKWDDETRHLVLALEKEEPNVPVIIDTSGVVFPDSFQNILEEPTEEDPLEDFVPNNIVEIIVRPQVIGMPVPEGEVGGYFQWLPDVLKKWLMFGVYWTRVNFVFEISEPNLVADIAQVIAFLQDLYEDENDGMLLNFDKQVIVFTLKDGDEYTDEEYMAYCKDLANTVGKMLLNLPNAAVTVQPNHSYLMG